MIEIKHLNKTFKTKTDTTEVFNDINLTVNDGELICLYGPSGSGKSTLLTIIGALQQSTSGQVIIDNKDLSQLSDAELTQLRLSDIGFIFQASHLIPYINVKDQLMYVAQLDKQSKSNASKKADQLLEAFGLSHRAKEYPKNLSGGEKQRTAIARAFMNEPSLILADEPTASLDFERAIQVIETIQKRVKETQTSCIIITHDTRIFKYADKVYKLENKTLIEEK
ncbi:ABC transporter ATP-binding protein [Macrococcus sp. DPC7161]|uniref:ABC transporter ATP-binding protein n=1 Tax=Macrococcus sp. DPC7161 TaxID=2507060 RepID=UPI00100BFEAC|nr:ABC transporter ATP-binding protein [Macrococcus sp. DPC7161]RXK17436.1 ABC transporter ATP-binding protein [Macrococcus sp. DPC7161]